LDSLSDGFLIEWADIDLVATRKWWSNNSCEGWNGFLCCIHKYGVDNMNRSWRLFHMGRCWSNTLWNNVSSKTNSNPWYSW